MTGMIPVGSPFNAHQKFVSADEIRPLDWRKNFLSRFEKIILTANQVNEFCRPPKISAHWKAIPVIQLLYRSDLWNKTSISQYQLPM
jgi:hypothetical protein